MASATMKTDTFSDEEDLGLAWNKLILRLQTEAHFNIPLDSHNALSVEEISAAINPPKADPSTKTRVKTIFSNALRLVDRFGAMIAQGASVVFGPSTQIFNAVSFLIRVSQDVQAVFDNLTTLMERLGFFLERLGGYIDREYAGLQLDKATRRSVYRVLEHFITIMAKSYKLTHSWKGLDEPQSFRGKLESFKGRAKVVLKVGAFGDDSGIKDSIAKFEGLIADLSKVQIDKIHQDMSDAARAICDISVEVHTISATVEESAAVIQESATVLQEHSAVLGQNTATLEELSSTSKQLKIKKDVMGALGTEKELESGSRVHRDFSARVPGTGEWIFARDDFQEWKDVRTKRVTDTRHNVFTIQGPEGYGKSFLSHAIFDHLTGESRKTEKPLNLRIARYFLSGDTRGDPVSQAIRYIIWQIATQDRAYMEFLGTATKDFRCADNQDISAVWKRLVTEYSEKKQAVVFFVLLDGVEHLDQENWEALRQLTKSVASSKNDSEGLRVRLMMTGNSDVFSELEDIPKLTIPSIDLLPSKSTPSEELVQCEDIRKFVLNRLTTIKIFQGDLTDEQKSLRAKLIDQLPAAARGNYNTLKRKIHDIEVSDDALQVEDVLKRINEDSSEAINREIFGLNARLSGRNIKQLNTLFMWIATAKEPPGVYVLNSALSMEFDDPGLFNPVEYLKKTCPSLVDFTKEGAVIFAPDVEKTLHDSYARRSTVLDEEVSLIQAMVKANFQRTFGDLAVFDKFEFPKFFREKRNVQTDLVHLDPAAANSAKVLKACVTAICDFHDSKKHEILRKYASRCFGDHLVETELAKVDLDLKQNIGKRLFRMFREDTVIDVWADEVQFLRMWEWFDDDNKVCEIIVEWMKDQDVKKSILAISADTEWISEITSGNAAKEMILQHVCRRALRRWYEDDSEYVQLVFTWLRKYFHKAIPRGRIYAQTSEDEGISASEFQDWEDWALAEFEPEDGDARWHYRMASAYYTMGSIQRSQKNRLLETAATRCDTAIKLDPNLWQACRLKATVFYDLGKYHDCIQQLETMLENHKSLLGQDKDYDDAYWNKVVRTIGNCHMRMNNLDHAATWYRLPLDRALEKNELPDSVEDHLVALLDVLNKQSNFQDALNVLHALDGKLQEDGQSWLMSILQSPFSKLHDHMTVLAHGFQALNDVDALYIKVVALVEGGKNSAWSGTVALLEIYRFRLKWHCGPADARASILNELEALVRTTKNNDLSWSLYISYRALQLVAYGLRSFATQCHFDSADVPSYLERLSKLSKDSSDIIDFEPSRDPRLILGRLYHLSGDDVEARNVLRPIMRRAIQLAKGEPKFDEGLSLLAHILPVLDDDVNALAAWSLMEPTREDQKKIKDTAIASSGPDIVANTDGVLPLSHVSKGAGANETSDQSTPAVVNSQKDITSDFTLDALDANVAPPDGVGAFPIAESGLPPAKLEGTSYCFCDGECEHSWSFADDMWVCKDCFDTQLCAQCYPKLKAGQLSILICDREHEHLHIPSFDEKAWRTLDPKSVRVGSRIVTKRQWLIDLEREWHVDAWNRAAAAIGVWKRLWLRRRKMLAKSQETASTTASKTFPAGLVRSATANT